MRKIFILLAGLLLTAHAEAAPRVMASIMPIHSIVSAVMGNLGQPELIFSGKLSEHSTSLSPAQIAWLGKADLVFMTGKSLEYKLGQLSGSETVNGKTFIALADAPGVTKLKLRQGGAWEKDEDKPQVAAADDRQSADGLITYNAHVWLDPENAKAMAKAVAQALGQADAANAANYQANAKAFAAEIDKTETEIAASLAEVKDRPFIVFHDAYPYFEQYFGLTAVGSISDASANAPSARRIEEIRVRIREAHAVCVFREPQFDSKFADTVIEGSDARAGVLDAIGADLVPGPGAYRQLLLNLAASAKSCLAGGNG